MIGFKFGLVEGFTDSLVEIVSNIILSVHLFSHKYCKGHMVTSLAFTGRGRPPVSFPITGSSEHLSRATKVL